MALATSPCLYGVKLACSWRDSEGDDDFNQEAMLELVAGLAPNLKEVVVINLMPENAMWSKHTDFSSLRHLTLGGGHGCENMGMDDEVMEKVAQNYCFPRLKTLCIRLERNDRAAKRPNYANSAIALFRSLEPLDELSVSGPLEPQILDAILYRHGQTLSKLSVRPYENEFTLDNGRPRRETPMTFSKEHVLQIQAQCPGLKELAVSIKRTKSDAVEAEIYKTFGKMEQLQSLFLTLDCSDWRVTRDPESRDDPSFDETDRETFKSLDYLKNGHLRENLMNCAVDETLARSVWETICQNKVGRRLESLKLWTTRGGQWGNSGNNGGIPPVINHLSRSWLIERVARDDMNDITVRELGRQVREARDLEMTDGMKRVAEYLRAEKEVEIEPVDVAEDSEVIKVFRRVWPRKEGSKDWREDWSSLPLQV